MWSYKNTAKVLAIFVLLTGIVSLISLSPEVSVLTGFLLGFFLNELRRLSRD